MTIAPDSALRYEPIAVSDQSTVVAEFSPDDAKETGYQSEADLERSLVDLLQQQAYEYLPITSEADLVANLRAQLEALNDLTFSDDEWKRFFSTRISSANEGIVEKTARIQEDHVQLLTRDDSTTKNVRLIDKQNIHNNRLQVINQYEIAGVRSNRYDVTILVNGLPLVHVELKRRGVDIREAFNQINRYQRDSFWAGSGLFEYVQLFVISNGTLTKYYSNTTRELHIGEMREGRGSKKKSSHSFEFTSWWADAQNKRIADLTGFTRTFFAKHALLNILTKYCVFDVDRNLLVMRPYQIVAAERILQRIATSSNHGQLGSVAAGGYVWHTTGSGKTLTSFKAAQLATRMPGVEKVLFVVDRKDLDYQTMREYDRFEKGAANSNTSTAKLKEDIENPDSKIIVTTIQKLSRFIEQNKKHEIFGGHIVLIFDECHRSQFGDMHVAIKKAFKNYYLFGFTGTPIFDDNASSGGNSQLRTTDQAFGDRLHTYTIVDAIADRNVLPFRIDYINTVRAAEGIVDKNVSAIDTEEVLLAHERLKMVAEYIVDHFDMKTKRNSRYRTGGRELSGFNSIFATASIDAAKRYYAVFKQVQAERAAADPTYTPLKIGLIYSYAANEEDADGLLAEEEFETDALDGSSRDFLDDAIKDYNAMFGTSFDTSGDRFEAYYKHISEKLRNRELDMVIVVNMFLTGFDATTLNTLWVDKNLHHHGLVQAFSRTNRILNSVKAFGSIVCFRDLTKEVDNAFALFGNKDAIGTAVLKPYGEFLDEYNAKVLELVEHFPLGEEIVGENEQKAFVALFGAILKLRNILTTYDEFADDDTLEPRVRQDYQSIYLNLYQEFRGQEGAEREPIKDDVVFEIELIKQVEVNVEYILALVRELVEVRGTARDTELRDEIGRAIDASPSLRNKKDLIEEFVDSVSITTDVDASWQAYVARAREEELNRIIAEENLNPAETVAFVESAFRDGAIPTSGTAITRILPPVSRFSGDGGHAVKKQGVIERLVLFFDRFFGLG